MNIAVFASHGGSDLQAIIDGCKNNQINAKVAVVISNNGDSMALERARNEGIVRYHLSTKTEGTEELLAEKILDVLGKYKIDMIFLAGYMRLLHKSILKKYHNRVFNIHPALLPKYGGKGMYGINVHKAVIQASENETGITIHRVNAEYDSGEIVAQTKVPVLKDDTPETLGARVLDREHTFLVEVIADIVEGKIELGLYDMNLIKINETNKIEYKQFEQDTDLYDYQSRIYPDETCDIVLWYYINEDDKKIGSVWLEIKHRTDKEAKLGIFIADPMYRGMGIGRKAIDEIIRLNALKYGLSLIRLNVRENNIRAQRAYLSCGFVEKDRYVKENGVAVVSMEKES